MIRMADEFTEGSINKPKDISTHNRLETKNNSKPLFPHNPFPLPEKGKELKVELPETKLTQVDPQSKRTLRISIFENTKKRAKEQPAHVSKEIRSMRRSTITETTANTEGSKKNRAIARKILKFTRYKVPQLQSKDLPSETDSSEYNVEGKDFEGHIMSAPTPFPVSAASNSSRATAGELL